MTRAHVKTPGLPNFVTVIVGKNEMQISIADLDDEDIDDLGRRWTLELKRLAKTKRESTETMNAALARAGR